MKSPDPSNPSGDALESRFDAVSPAPVSGALLQRLQRVRPDLTEFQPGFIRRVRFPAWRFLAAAAAVVTVGGWFFWQPPPPAAPQASGPPVQAASPPPAGAAERMAFYPALESRQQLLGVRDLGVVRDSRERPVRLIRTLWLDENTYGDQGEKPVLHETRFRHEIVPVLLPTY